MPKSSWKSILYLVKCGIIDRKGSGSTRLILASGSRGRREVLDKVGFSYEARASNISEVSDKTDPREYVMDLSRQKALCVSEFYKDGVIIGADSIVYINGKKLEKPKSLEEAREMMRELSGKVNEAYTGLRLLIYTKIKRQHLVKLRVFVLISLARKRLISI